jgi:hypothetical protein
MPGLSLTVDGQRQVDKVIALLCLGFVKAIRSEAITFDEAGRQLFWPWAWGELALAGCSSKLIYAVQLGSELTDVADLIPRALEASLTKVENLVLEVLQEHSSIPEKDEKRWLRAVPQPDSAE